MKGKKRLLKREGFRRTKNFGRVSKKYKISRERIRQIETKEKLQKSMISASKSKNLLPAN